MTIHSMMIKKQKGDLVIFNPTIVILRVNEQPKRERYLVLMRKKLEILFDCHTRQDWD